MAPRKLSPRLPRRSARLAALQNARSHPSLSLARRGEDSVAGEGHNNQASTAEQAQEADEESSSPLSPPPPTTSTSSPLTVSPYCAPVKKEASEQVVATREESAGKKENRFESLENWLKQWLLLRGRHNAVEGLRKDEAREATRGDYDYYDDDDVILATEEVRKAVEKLVKTSTRTRATKSTAEDLRSRGLEAITPGLTPGAYLASRSPSKENASKPVPIGNHFKVPRHGFKRSFDEQDDEVQKSARNAARIAPSDRVDGRRDNKNRQATTKGPSSPSEGPLWLPNNRPPSSVRVLASRKRTRNTRPSQSAQDAPRSTPVHEQKSRRVSASRSKSRTSRREAAPTTIPETTPSNVPRIDSVHHREADNYAPSGPQEDRHVQRLAEATTNFTPVPEPPTSQDLNSWLVGWLNAPNPGSTPVISTYEEVEGVVGPPFEQEPIPSLVFPGLSEPQPAPVAGPSTFPGNYQSGSFSNFHSNEWSNFMGSIAIEPSAPSTTQGVVGPAIEPIDNGFHASASGQTQSYAYQWPGDVTDLPGYAPQSLSLTQPGGLGPAYFEQPQQYQTDLMWSPQNNGSSSQAGASLPLANIGYPPVNPLLLQANVPLLQGNMTLQHVNLPQRQSNLPSSQPPVQVQPDPAFSPSLSDIFSSLSGSGGRSPSTRQI